MTVDGRSREAVRGDPRCEPRLLLRRLVDAGVPSADSVRLILAHPSRTVADALDALDELGQERVPDVPRWLATAIRDPSIVEGILDRGRGWASWRRQHAAWDAADAAHREQQRRSAGWGAVVSHALDDEQLADAVAKATRPVGGLDRRSIPVTRAQLLAWAVAVHRARPGRELGDALRADLAHGPTALDPLDEGLPEPSTEPDEQDDLSERLAMALARHPDLADDGSADVPTPPPPEPEPVLERAIDRGF